MKSDACAIVSVEVESIAGDDRASPGYSMTGVISCREIAVVRAVSSMFRTTSPDINHAGRIDSHRTITDRMRNGSESGIRCGETLRGCPSVCSPLRLRPDSGL